MTDSFFFFFFLFPFRSVVGEGGKKGSVVVLLLVTGKVHAPDLEEEVRSSLSVSVVAKTY